MSPLEAARLGDEIGHTDAWSWLLKGLVIGFVVTGLLLFAAAATIGTGGAALAVIIGGLMAGTASGGLSGMAYGATSDLNPKGPIITGSPNTFLGGNIKPAARAVEDKVECEDHSEKRIAQGSRNVFINNVPAARKSDMTECSGTIMQGQPDVFFGGPGETYLEIEPEVPTWVVTVLTVTAWAGAGIATGGAAFTVGIGAALGGLVGSVGLGYVGGKLGRAIGGQLGGEREAVVGEIVGSFLFGSRGGRIGGRAGAALEGRLPTATLARLPGSTPQKIAARQQVARRYYEGSRDYQNPDGTPNVARIESHMAGIDFTRPVSVRSYRSDRLFGQYQNKSNSTIPEVDRRGNFIAKHGTRPTDIGLGDRGRAPDGSYGPKSIQDYVLPARTKVLVSTASPMKDTFSVGSGKTGTDGVFYETVAQSSRGGGQQIGVGDKSKLRPVGDQREANPSLFNRDTPRNFEPGTTTTFRPPRNTPAQVPVRGDGTYTPTDIPGTGGTVGITGGAAVGGTENANRKP
ncbi:PAAR domain-containing protein [Polyangium aurulentum]|uniref:PAAR domain-containing protein n=1 Tax=Polyangium aurulentum TaxID=2567896 RepID=UPI0010AED083|nr:PAAR domain-containing protein [Polyangium aurulentum]UQA56371.1 PAAR domain-containing protein [Polyangium aurulentum]